MHKISVAKSILKGFIISVLMILESFLLSRFNMMWIIILMSVIFCVAYMRIYYCKTEHEVFDVLVSAIIFSAIALPFVMFIFLTSDMFFNRSFGVFAFVVYLLYHIFITLIASIVGILLSSRYQNKHLSKEYVDGEEIYFYKGD
jgi:hypothetical protein